MDMNLHQLRFVREAVRNNYNLTLTSKALFTSQPGVSKAILELEHELGVDIFTRKGKRLLGLTPPGETILKSVQTILDEIETIKTATQGFLEQESGSVAIAATYTQARYVLPALVQRLTQIHPQVRLSLLQGSPAQIAEMVQNEQADLALLPQTAGYPKSLVRLPLPPTAYIALVPAQHPLLELPALTTGALGAWPIVTYERAFPVRMRLERMFELQRLRPNVMVQACDADIIKTCVENRVGVGIVERAAFEAGRDTRLRALEIGHLLGADASCIALRRGARPRRYIYTLLQLLDSALDQATVERALREELGVEGGTPQRVAQPVRDEEAGPLLVECLVD
jgi:LysR family cys regulon transcriptional activator